MQYIVTINGKKYEVEVERSGAATVETAPKQVKKNPTEVRETVSTGSEMLRAPMPGSIADMKVTVGQPVHKGQVLLILEAMKMENEILADRDGIVERISVSKGENVNTGDSLLSLK